MKIALCAYSYRKYMRYIYDPIHNIVRTKGEMELENFCKKAYELELDGIELTAYYFPSTESAYLRNLKRVALSYGLDIAATAVGNNFCLPKENERQEQVDRVKKWINVTADLGAPCMRVFAGEPPREYTENDAFNWTINALKTCAEYAEEKGIVLALENQRGIASRAEGVLKILNAVNSKWVQHLLDVGNYAYYESMYEEIKKSALYAVHVHARQEAVVTSVGEKKIDYQRVKEILRSVGYNGYLSIEYEGVEDAITGVPKTVELLRDVFHI